MNTACKIAATAIAFATLGLADAGDITANIGFPFSVRGVAQSPASYTVRTVGSPSGTKLFLLRNDETRRALLMPSLIRSDSKNKDARARLVFHCLETCWISEMWDMAGIHYTASAPPVRVAAGPKVRVATVYLDRRVGN